MAINLTAAMPAHAASVRLEAHSPHQITTDISFADMIMVIPLASPQSIAASTTLNVGPLNMLHLVLLLACAARIVAALPMRKRRPALLRRYCALAASAMSWMRCTIARNPFERWAERCSFRPSRPNSADASTERTSSTVNPS